MNFFIGEEVGLLTGPSTPVVVWKTKMTRLISLVALILCSLAAASQTPLVTQVLTISIYAPRQKRAPLHIGSFNYQPGGIGAVVHNDSDKVITGLYLSALIDAPSGCALNEPDPGHIRHNSMPGSKISLHIGPGRSYSTPKDDPPLSPAALVMAAQMAQYGFLHVQVAIVAEFADGTTWPTEGLASDDNPAGLIDPKLAAAENGVCGHTDLDATFAALAQISQVGFNTNVKLILNTDTKDSSGIPHLAFNCSLEGRQATCPWVD